MARGERSHCNREANRPLGEEGRETRSATPWISTPPQSNAAAINAKEPAKQKRERKRREREEQREREGRMDRGERGEDSPGEEGRRSLPRQAVDLEKMGARGRGRGRVFREKK